MISPSYKRLRRVDAARYLKDVHGLDYAVATLAKLACLGGGPRFEHGGRFPLYREDELDKWAHTKISPLKRSTSDPGEITATQAA